MANIVLFIKNFQLGTKISESLIDLNQKVKFADDERYGMSEINESTNMVILDLDDSVFQTLTFITSLRKLNKNMKIIGFMKVIHKETYERLKASGCDIILPRSSFVKNIPTLID
jgi:hypothetical protein